MYKHSKKLLKTLNRIENEIAENSYETAIFISKDGKELFRRKGTEAKVSFTESEIDKINDGNGLIVTHNHPTNISFTRMDILFMKKACLREIRAVGKDYLYSARFTRNIGIDEINKSILDVEYLVRLDFVALIRKGKMSMSSASTKHWHEV